MALLETRELMYFLAVAEELHFGRAARRLAMAQPPLSRAIRQLEQRLGVPLFERTSRAVHLTPAGAVLLVESRKALDAITAAAHRTQRAAHHATRLVVATKPEGDAGLLEKIIPLYQGEPDAADVEVIVCRMGEQAQLLRDGRADLAILHAPHDDLDGLDSELLLTQGHVAVLPPGHHLARQVAVTTGELDEDALPRWPHVGPGPLIGPPVHDVAQLLQLVALGQMIAILPESVRRHARSDVAYVPLLDAATSSVLLAWPQQTRSRVVAAFVRAAAQAAAHSDAATTAPQHT